MRVINSKIKNKNFFIFVLALNLFLLTMVLINMAVYRKKKFFDLLKSSFHLSRVKQDCCDLYHDLVKRIIFITDLRVAWVFAKRKYQRNSKGSVIL